MAVLTERYVFDSDNILVAIGRNANTGETLRNLNRSQVSPGVSTKRPCYWNGSKVVLGSPPNALVDSTVLALEVWNQKISDGNDHLRIALTATRNSYQDFTVYALRGLYLAMHNLTGTTMTVAQRTKYAEEFASAPSDALTGKSLVEKMVGETAPTQAISIVSIPSDGSNPAALTVKNIVTVTGDIPATVDLRNSDWALSLT